MKLSANCASASAVAPLFPACRCDSGANGARPPDHFHSPHPDGRPRQPTADTLPHSFLRPPRPTVRPFPTGRNHRSAPLAPSNPLPPRKAANGALPFSPFSAPILYIRAREGDFSSLRREGIGAPGGGKTERWGETHRKVDIFSTPWKDCGKQIVDKWKIGAYFPPLRNERRRSGERRPSSGALNRESAARSPQSPTRGGENLH